MRIHKLLSDQGIASRRGAERLIEEGRVTVNGRPAVIGQDVNPAQDIVHIDNERVAFVKKAQRYYILLNKPRGYVTTMADEMGRRCVAELLSDLPARVYPIGRLDKDSEGLLLLTNDGEFANFIMHPKNHVSKTYRVTLRPDITEDQIITLCTGVTLDDGSVTAPAQVQVESRETGRVVLRMTIYEGKNRQIRRMCEALSLEVARLRRVSIGPIRLGMVQPGKWRELTPAEVTALRGAITTVNPASAGEPKHPRRWDDAKSSARAAKPKDKPREKPAFPRPPKPGEKTVARPIAKKAHRD